MNRVESLMNRVESLMNRDESCMNRVEWQFITIHHQIQHHSTQIQHLSTLIHRHSTPSHTFIMAPKQAKKGNVVDPETAHSQHARHRTQMMGVRDVLIFGGDRSKS